MNDIKYDCIIIGGGISGISFAYYMSKIGRKVLIIEKEANTGGQVQSIHSQEYPDYWRELGAHTCYNSYTHLLSITKEIESTDLIRPLGKGSYVTYSDGKIKKMFTGISVPSLILNGTKMFFVSKRGKTVKEYFSKIVGKKNYNKLFTYLFRAVISQNADNYPAEQFLKKRNNRYKEFPRKYSFKKGLGAFLDSVIEKSSLQIEKSCEVIGIRFEKNGYKIITLEGKTFYAANIALATDPKTTSRLLKDMEDSLSDLLASISLFNTESINVIIRKEKLSLGTIAGIIPVSDDFHSVVSRDLIEDENLRSFTFHFGKGDRNENEKFAIICKVLDIVQNDIVEWKMVRHVLPSLRLPHLNMAEQVSKVKKSDNIYILGNYFYGLSLEDCIHRSYDESERFKRQNI